MENVYKTIFDNSITPMSVMDSKGQYLDYNYSYMDIFGCKVKSELASWTSGKLFPKLQPDGELSSVKAKRMIELAFSQGENEFEWNHISTKGRSFLSCVTLKKTHWYDQEVLLVVIEVIEDIEELHKLERLKEIKKESKLRNLYLNSINTLVIVLDTEAKITMINKIGCFLLGFKEEELIGHNWFDIGVLPKDIVEEVRKYFKYIVSGEMLLPEGNYENELLSKNGEKFIFSWSNSLLKNDNTTT